MQAQEGEIKKLPLKKVLSIIEKRYSISFSYADVTIENKYSILPNENKTLAESFALIEESADLVFEKLNNRFVVVKKKKKTFLLNEKLDEVAVTGYLTTGISKNVDSSITIKTNELGILPGLIEPDVLQIVKALPGVVSSDETISNLNIRGGTNDQNLVLFDGIRMYKTGHFFGLISAFNPNLKYNVTLSKSGSDAKYGEGVSSVIDMRLPEEIVNDGLKFESGINLLNVDFTSVIPVTKNAEIQFSARRSITDFLTTPTYETYFERVFQDSDLQDIRNNNSVLSKGESFWFYDVSGKFIWNITKNDKLKMVFLNINNDLSYEESLINSDKDQDFTSQLSQTNVTAGITYEKKWNSNLQIEAKAYYTNYELFSNNADILNEQNLIQENKVEDNGFTINADYKLTDKTSILSGYQFSQIAVSNLEDIDNPLFRRLIKEVMISHIAFSSLSYSSERVALKFGLRGNYFTKLDKFTVEPRLSFNFKIDDKLRVELTGDLKSQSISQIIDLQNDFLGVEKERWVLADNEETPLVISRQIALGFYYQKNKLLISGEGYLKNVEGISSRSQGFQNQFQFQSDVGGYESSGIDFLIQKKWNNFFTWVSYSFMRNNYSFENLNSSENFPNNIDIRNIINFSGTFSRKNIDVALGLNWHSGKPFTAIYGLNNDSAQIEYKDPNAGRINEFLRLDSSVSYKFKLGSSNAKVGLSVWNILNNENVLNRHYEVINDQISQIDNISLGVTPNISFRVAF